MRPTPRLHRLVGIAVLVASALRPLTGAGPVDVRGDVRAGRTRLANAVVWLEAAVSHREPAHAVVDQRNLRFAPQVLAVQVGTTVAFPNSDRVFHNVFSFRDGKRFDLGLYPAGATMRVQFDKPGVSRLFCNIHPGMAGYVVSLDTPYYAVSDSQGAFRIAEVPVGTYTFPAWRPGGPDLSGRYDAASGQPLAIRWP